MAYLARRPYLLSVAWTQHIVRYAEQQHFGLFKLAKECVELMKLYGIIPL